MVNLLQNAMWMLVPLALACEQEWAEAKLPGARDLYSTVARAARHTCRQEMERIVKLYDATDATLSLCAGVLAGVK